MMLLRRITCRGQRACRVFHGTAPCHPLPYERTAVQAQNEAQDDDDALDLEITVISPHLNGLLRLQLAAAVGVDGVAGAGLPPQRLAAVIHLVSGQV